MTNKKSKANIVVKIESIVLVIVTIVVGALSLQLILHSLSEPKFDSSVIKLNEVSPCGEYTATVDYRGKTGTFGDAIYYVNLRNAEDDYIIREATVYVDDNDYVGTFTYDWSDTYFKITFDGDEQSPNTIILPFEQEDELE